MSVFRKPPVLEVWISFEFTPSETKQAWELPVVRDFVLQYAARFPRLEVVHEKELDVEETSAQDLPTVVAQRVRVQRVRISDERRQRVLQIGDDQLSFHLLRSESGHPRYQEVRNELQPILEHYFQTFQPSLIRSATLHYLDVIDIPCPPEGRILLKDYFVGCPDVPEQPFGLISGMLVQYQLGCPMDEGPLLLRLMSIPAAPDSGMIRFRMEWHKQCANLNTLDLGQAWSRLETAHVYIAKCFRAALTQRTLELFEPSEEE